MKLFIDRNIEINAITHKTIAVAKTIKWGPKEERVEVAQRIPFPPRDDENFRIEQLPYLAALCAYARDGNLEFFTSHEITMEKFRQKGRGEGYLGSTCFGTYLSSGSPLRLNDQS